MKFKTAYYTFYLPIACGLHLSGITDPQAFATAQSISEEMGLYFQIQDDYLDCYADPEVLGKIGTDIQDNKCGWLMCSALQIATPEQREILSTNYGRDEEACIQKVKAVYAYASSLFRCYSLSCCTCRTVCNPCHAPMP